MNSHILTTLRAVLCAVPSIALLPAADFHTIAGVDSDTVDFDFYPADQLIEGPGVGFDANPPHARMGTLTWVTNDPNGGTGDYFDPVPWPEPRLVFDLGADVALAEISVWGYGISGNSLKDFSLRFATSAEGPDGIGTSIAFNPGFVAQTPPGPRQSFMFGQAVTARYVEFTPLDNYYDIEPPGGDRVGFGEVAFENITIAATPKIDLPASVSLEPASIPLAFSLQVRNLGQQTLTLTGSSFTGSQAAAFSVIDLPATLPPLSHAVVQLQFNPAGLPVGPIGASFVVESNDPASATTTVEIDGSVPPEPANDFHPIAGVSSATVDFDFFAVDNLIQGKGAGFHAEQPHQQIGTLTWVTNVPNGGAGDYFNPLPDPAPLITVDLGADVPLSEISLWGYATTNANGMADFSLQFATSAEGPEAPGTSIAYNPHFVLPFGFAERHRFWFPQVIAARYVLITPLDNYFASDLAPGGDRVGFGEVAFEILPSTTGKKLAVLGTRLVPVSETATTFEVALRNTGSEAVAISNPALSGPQAASFSIVTAPASVGPHSHAAFTLVFDPALTSVTPAEATLAFSSDDPALPTGSIALSAAAILPPAGFYEIVDVFSDTMDTDFYSAFNLIEGIDLGFDGQQPHLRLSDSTWVTDAPNGGTGDYFEPVPEPAPRLVFDLGEDVTLGEISVWGYGIAGNSMKDFSLRFATSAEGPEGAGASITYNPTFIAQTPPGPRQSFSFDQVVLARYVELTPLDNYFGVEAPGGDRVGFGEVAFQIVSGPPPGFPAFSITSIALNDGQVSLVFESVAGGSYTVNRSISLLNWSPVGTAVTGQAGTTTFTDPAPPADAPAVFYRVTRTE